MLTLIVAAAFLCTPFYNTDTDLYGYRACDGTISLPATMTIAEPFNACGIAPVLDDAENALLFRQLQHNSDLRMTVVISHDRHQKSISS